MSIDQTRLRAHSPADLLALVPYLLSFHPEESLVFVLTQGTRVVVTGRVDISEQTAPFAALFTDVALEHSADGLAVVAFCSDSARGLDLLKALVPQFEKLPVHTAVVADGQRWWSALDDEIWSCDEGVEYDSASNALAAEAVLAGLPVLPSRAVLAEQVQGPSGREHEETVVAFEEVLPGLAEATIEAREDRLEELLDGFSAEPGPLTARECAELAVLVYDTSVREVAINCLRRTNAHLFADLWNQVVRRTVAPFEMAPLCLLGLAGWLTGNGALQVVCIERGEGINPDFTLLGVLQDINARAMAPSAWEDDLVA